MIESTTTVTERSYNEKSVITATHAGSEMAAEEQASLGLPADQRHCEEARWHISGEMSLEQRETVRIVSCRWILYLVIDAINSNAWVCICSTCRLAPIHLSS